MSATSPSPSLFPGYTHVSEFGPDDCYESEEEVVYVTLDLGNVEPTLVPNAAAYRLIGLDTPTPFLQIAGTVFKGAHRPLMGTELLFRDGDDEPDRTKKTVTHVANTSIRIRFAPVELRPASAAPPPPPPLPIQRGRGKNPGRPMGAKKLREEAWTLQQTTDEMTGAAPARERPRRKPGPKARVEIEVQESDGEEDGVAPQPRRSTRKGKQVQRAAQVIDAEYEEFDGDEDDDYMDVDDN